MTRMPQQDEELQSSITNHSRSTALDAIDDHTAADAIQRRRTLICINTTAIVERIEEQLLPALYRFVGASFNASPSQLGYLTLARALSQAIFSPIAGLLGHRYSRITIIVIGAIVWGTCTTGFSMTTSIATGLPLWALNGAALSFLIPQAQSLVADYHRPSERGKAFGLLHLTGAVGALVGALFATNIGGTRPFGMEGWRFAFLMAAAASYIIGAATRVFAVDPRYLREGSQYKVYKAADILPHSTWRTTLRGLWGVVTIPTFLIIVLQGIVGTTPWYSLSYMTFYLSLLNMSDLAASLLMAVFLSFNAVGGLLGGFIGDWAAERWPNHGRIVVCQFSVGIGVPLSIILFKALPMNGEALSMILYAIVLAVTGLTITWAATACNNPIFSEIVPEHMRNIIYSFDRSFEGAFAAMGAPLAGILAEKAFGFSGTAEKSDNPEENIAKAKSLGNALLVFTTVPWFLCAVFFSGLHWTYPKDKQRAVPSRRWLPEEEERIGILAGGGIELSHVVTENGKTDNNSS